MPQPESILDFRTSDHEILAARARSITHGSQINLAIALVGSEDTMEVEEGAAILEETLRDAIHSEDSRICIHYLAVAHARLRNYDKSLSLLDALLLSEPSNMQATALRKVVEKKMKREGLLGLGLLGGAAAVIGGIVIAGFALKNK